MLAKSTSFSELPHVWMACFDAGKYLPIFRYSVFVLEVGNNQGIVASGLVDNE